MARRTRRVGDTAGQDGPRIGMRLWLAATFAAVGVITAGTVYLFVSASSGRVLSDRTTGPAVGRTITLADRVGDSRRDPRDLVSGAEGAGFQAWVFDDQGKLIAPVPGGIALERIPGRGAAVDAALAGGRYKAMLPGGELTAVAVPVIGPGGEING